MRSQLQRSQLDLAEALQQRDLESHVRLDNLPRHKPERRHHLSLTLDSPEPAHKSQAAEHGTRSALPPLEHQSEHEQLDALDPEHLTLEPSS